MKANIGVIPVGINGFPALLLDVPGITRQHVVVAEQHAARDGSALVDAIAALGVITEAGAYRLFAEAAGAEFVIPESVQPSELALRLVPERLARKHLILPMSVDNRVLTYATSRPLDHECERDLGFASGRRAVARVAPRTALIEAIDLAYPKLRELDVLASRLNAERPIVEAEDAGSPVAAHSVVIDLCNHIIGRAVEVGASDVHIECGARGIAVRFRICGVLEPVLTLPAAVSVPIRNRFKILGGADIAIRHRPQDGAFRVKVNSRLIDVRLRRRMLELQQRLAIQVGELRKAIASMTQLRGLLPICAYCKRVRADQDYWQQLESYISAHSDAQFSHGICPECFEKAEFDLEAPSWKGP